MESVLGMKIMVSPCVQVIPVLQLSPTFDSCTPECKSMMNTWLLDMFGTKEIVYMIGNDTLVVSPKMFSAIKLTTATSLGNLL